MPGHPSGFALFDDMQFKKEADSYLKKIVPCQMWIPTNNQIDLVVVLRDYDFPWTGTQPISTKDCMNFSWQLAILGVHPILDIELTTDQTDDRRSIAIMLWCPTKVQEYPPMRLMRDYLLNLYWDHDAKKFSDTKKDVRVLVVGEYVMKLMNPIAITDERGSRIVNGMYDDPSTFFKHAIDNPEKIRHQCKGNVDLSQLPMAEAERSLNDIVQMPSYEYVSTKCKYCTGEYKI